MKTNKHLNVDDLINSLEKSLENYNRVAILALCFMIPDLLSKKTGNNKKENYIKWFDNNIKEHYNYDGEIGSDLIDICVDGKLFYALRCSFLHAGNTEIITKNLDLADIIVEFVYDKDTEFSVEIESYGKIKYDGKTIKKVRLNIEKMASIFIKSLQCYERK